MVALEAIQVCTGKETRGRNEEIGGGGGICNAFKGMLVLAVVVRQLAEGGVEAKVSLKRKEKRRRQRQFENEWLDSWFSRSAMLQWKLGEDWTVNKFLFDRWQ